MGFKKVTTRAVSPPGLERRLLRDIPKVLLGGLLVPAIFVWLSPMLMPEGMSAVDLEKQQVLVRIVAVAVAVVVWTGALTVSIGCWFVMVMKGPVYEADSYRVNDRAAPTDQERDPLEPHPAAQESIKEPIKESFEKPSEE